ncbi:MAG: CorA family divalent cation transporter [Lachnospiraceae bacterium]|nr:CorA family divalent cation transporter [Lachnospiraceae bacterium]
MIGYQFEPSEGRPRPLSKVKEKESANILLMTKAELMDWDAPIRYRKNLISSIGEVKYCKLDRMKGCLQGSMLIPEGIEQEGKVHFGFYADDTRLVFIEEEKVVEKLLGKIAQHSYEAGSLRELLLVIFETIVEDDVLNIQKIEGQLFDLEEQLIKSVPDHFNETLMRFRKRLSAYHSYYQQLVNIADSMQDTIGGETTETESIGWQRYGYRVERLHNYVETLREYLIQIREMYQSRIQEQQNHVMSLLTVITTIFFPLTLITGWYGMNFLNMPELESQFGYPMMIGTSALIILLEIIYFKKKKMF